MPHRIVYFSRNRIDGDDDARRGEIENILARARRNNERANVTGALLFNSGGFAQALEGDIADLEAVFERIQCDPRHSDVLVLDYTPIETRRFENWSMAFIGDRHKDKRLFGAVSETSGFDPRHLRGVDVFQEMQRLVREEEQVVSA